MSSNESDELQRLGQQVALLQAHNDALRKELDVQLQWRDWARKFENYGAQAAHHLKMLTSPPVPDWVMEGAIDFLRKKPPYPNSEDLKKLGRPLMIDLTKKQIKDVKDLKSRGRFGEAP